MLFLLVSGGSGAARNQGETGRKLLHPISSESDHRNPRNGEYKTCFFVRNCESSIFSREFPREFPGEFPREFLKEFPREFPKEFLREFLKEFPREFPKEFPREWALCTRYYRAR